MHRSRSSGKTLSCKVTLIHDFLSLLQSLICYFRPGCLADRPTGQVAPPDAGATGSCRHNLLAPVGAAQCVAGKIGRVSPHRTTEHFFLRAGATLCSRVQGAHSISAPTIDFNCLPAAGKESAMASRDTQPLRRTIRRHQLREMVPLADSTIYEMEQRGEFPRRFALSPRCIVWDLAEIEAWLDARRNKPVARAPHPDVARRRTRPVKAGVRK
jgi:prophage regulatory protein